MRFNFTIYPEALTKLRESNLEQRFLEASGREDFPYVNGNVFDDELRGGTNDLKEKGYFKTIPSEFKEDYKIRIETLYKNLLSDENKFYWIIKKPEGEVKEISDNFDLDLLSGWIASLMLGPDELWDFRKFGFSSIFEFLGTFGALIKNGKERTYKQGYKWKSEFKGQSFVTEVTGSEHGDFRLFRTDITPYETLDPLGNKVNYRPQLRSDQKSISGYHSVEIDFFATILKYIEQENIKSEILKDKGIAFLEEVKQWNACLGPFADAGMGDSTRISFLMFDQPIVRLDENNSVIGDQTFSTKGIVTNFEEHYHIYVNNEGNLVFCREGDKDLGNRVKRPFVTIPSGEIDHLIRGLFVQASNGLGRTSLKQLVDILEYKFSKQFI